MKNSFCISIVTIMLTVAAFAQQPAQPEQQPMNIYAAGVTFNNGASPAVAGSGLFARKLVDNTGTYAFTVVDVLPTSVKPFTINTNFSAGIAQKLFTIGNVRIYSPNSAGISFNGNNTGWAFTTGALAVIPTKHNFSLMPNVRLVKSSVSQNSGYQVVAGFMFGWGK